jgi:hypothetical protein
MLWNRISWQARDPCWSFDIRIIVIVIIGRHYFLLLTISTRQLKDSFGISVASSMILRPMWIIYPILLLDIPNIFCDQTEFCYY